MKIVIALTLLGTLMAALPNPCLDEKWEQFKADHNKTYESHSEERMRRLIFEENHQFIEEHNAKGEFEFTLGMNHFGDLTNKEYRQIYLGYKRPKDSPSNADYNFSKAENVEDVPDQIDWRAKGYVTPIKNQGQCGSCWAFSAVGSLEGQHFRSTGKLVSLSEQNLVDCSNSEGNHGCHGGWMDNAFKYVIKNHGIDTEDSYPYRGVQGPCLFRSATVGATATGFVDVKRKDEEALRQAVGIVGPVSVAIDASSRQFQFYRRGVYNHPGCSSSKLDHGVLVVGYGKDGGKDFWMVKNSWGVGWGNHGYIEMSRNKENQCGIASAASFPTV